MAPAIVMLTSTVVFTVILLPLALTQKFLPATPHGWWLLVGCAISAQVLGQSLIAYALAHLPATFGAVGLYAQVIAAAGVRLAAARRASGAAADARWGGGTRGDRVRARGAARAGAGPRSGAARVDPVERRAPQRVAVAFGEETVVTERARADVRGSRPAPLDLRAGVGAEQRLDRSTVWRSGRP